MHNLTVLFLMVDGEGIGDFVSDCEVVVRLWIKVLFLLGIIIITYISYFLDPQLLILYYIDIEPWINTN